MGNVNSPFLRFAPHPQTGWPPHTLAKQSACRHSFRANVGFVDGHIESWGHADFATNKDAGFALRSR